MATTTLTQPSAQHFTVMWCNHPTNYDLPMVQHTAVLRGIGSGGIHGLTCRNLYIDQITVMYREPTSITQFAQDDISAYTFDTETDNLHVMLTPGDRYQAWAHRLGENDFKPVYTYSGVFVRIPSSSTYLKSYRPVRDLPVARNLHNVSNFQFHLQFPVLSMFNNSMKTRDFPDYRIKYVIIEFSVEE